MSDPSTHSSARCCASAGRWAALLPLAALAIWLVAQAAAVPESPSRVADSGVVAVTGQITANTYGIYLIDPRAGTICLYQWVSGRDELRLLAARTFVFDLQLDEYNTQPLPREIRQLVDRQRRLEE